jgi:hypothetical protein
MHVEYSDRCAPDTACRRRHAELHQGSAIDGRDTADRQRTDQTVAVPAGLRCPRQERARCQPDAARRDRGQQCAPLARSGTTLSSGRTHRCPSCRSSIARSWSAKGSTGPPSRSLPTTSRTKSARSRIPWASWARPRGRDLARNAPDFALARRRTRLRAFAGDVGAAKDQGGVEVTEGDYRVSQIPFIGPNGYR